MKNKHIYILSALCLFPSFYGILIWNKLPHELVIHFDIRGNPDGYASKWLSIIVLPIILAVLNLMIAYIKKVNSEDANTKQMEYVIHSILPITSNLVTFISISSGLSYTLPVNKIFMVYVGLIITIIGNYLPKCRHNIIIGIKLPTTIRNVDNWNFTHRITGFIWYFSGLIIIISGILNQINIIVLVLLLIIIAPLFVSLIFEITKK